MLDLNFFSHEKSYGKGHTTYWLETGVSLTKWIVLRKKFSCVIYVLFMYILLHILTWKYWLETDVSLTKWFQSCSTIIFLFATFSNILKYKYICNFKVNYYITCHWILEIYYFFHTHIIVLIWKITFFWRKIYYQYTCSNKPIMIYRSNTIVC
jgi:hypothetical protein